MLYPTTETVINNLLTKEQFVNTYEWGDKVILATLLWKDLDWKKTRERENTEIRWRSIAVHTVKINQLINPGEELNIRLGDIGGSMWTPTGMRQRDPENYESSCYSPSQKMITLNGKPSIITCWHELGHHLFGPDELTACIFSISLFKIIFPKAFEKLNWNGHMLTL